MDAVVIHGVKTMHSGFTLTYSSASLGVEIAVVDIGSLGGYHIVGAGTITIQGL